MKKRSIIVDVAVDQGGCIETTKATSHSNPVYEVDGIIHYCVANMPGAVPRTSTFALTNATFPYALEIANNGFVAAIKKDPALMKGVNVYKGKITYQAVADSQNQSYTDLYTLI
jgi:alanine dehydrogenase